MKTTKSLIKFIGLVTIVAGMFYLAFNINSANSKKSKVQNNNGSSVSSTQQNSGQSLEVKKVIPPDSLRLNTLFFGDVFWGRYMDDWSKKSPLKTAYPFSGLNTFSREKYDAWIAGIECPITSTYLDSAQQDKLLKFSCPTEYTSEAAKWFTAFTLANNHTDNMQEVEGLKQTRDNLDKNGIQYFGHYDNAVKSDICEIVSFKASPQFKNQVDNTSDKIFYIPVAMCGYHNVFKLPLEDELAVISQYSKYLPTIVMPHQGKEYSYIADDLQRTYYKKMIDLGADAVIGNHVHSVQNSEAYKGKLIMYSLGNFIFDQQIGTQVTQAVGANLDFNFENDENMQKWLTFSQECKKFKDNCLETAKKQNLIKPKFSIKYDLVGSDNSNKLTKKASDAVFQDLLKKVKWLETKKGLKEG